jgi:uncharacterized protein (DUF1330 family)
MPKSYVIITEDIHDPEGMAAYSKESGPTLGRHQAGVLVATQEWELLEGSWHGQKTVVLEFESREAALAWYRSPEYQKAAQLRHASSTSNAVVLDGLSPPSPK